MISKIYMLPIMYMLISILCCSSTHHVCESSKEGNQSMSMDNISRNEESDSYYSFNTHNINEKIGKYKEMEHELQAFVNDKDARIGISVIINGKDTVSVNGNREFPMLSVYKFPQALSVADYCLKKGLKLESLIDIKADEIKKNTWSPLREKYGITDLKLPISELLEYSLQQSDNNACDILFNLIGSPEVTDSLMKTIGYPAIVVSSTEEEMHRDLYLCYQNRSTPLEMARLFDHFYRNGLNDKSSIHKAIGEMMIYCDTGLNRLPYPLKSEKIKIGHKTGTGDINSQGRIIGINDAGYVFLPNGEGYAIAVFISDSAYDMPKTEKMIGDISSIVFNMLTLTHIDN